MSLLTWSLVTLLCLSSVAADPLHFPITRRAGTKTIEDYANARDSLRIKYGYQPPSNRKRQKSTGVSIINQNSDTSYLATVSIGTPGQNFNVVLDTGSSDLWVTDSTCTTCDSSTPAFKPSDSSTYQMATTSTGQPATVTIQYGSGAVAGNLVRDTVSMGGFQVTQQQWLLVDETSAQLLSGSDAGIMGLAFQGLATTGAVPFWQALANANQFSSPEMSFWINRLISQSSTSSTETFGGIFTLGGTNSSLYTGDIEFLNLVSTSTLQYWLLEVSEITVQGSKVSISAGGNAAIDTGTTLIGGPSSDVSAIYAAIPGSQALTGQMQGYYGYPCSTDVSVTMSFGGKSWPISTADMNLGRFSSASSLCVGGIFDLNTGSTITAGGGNPSWVVGDTFLKNVYSVFRSNPASVGFAQLSSAAGGSSASSVPSTATFVPPKSSGSPGSGTGTGSGTGSSSSSGAGGVASTATLPSSMLLAFLAGALTLA